MLRRWGEWKIGFGQFIELESVPSEDDLWVLLARRAAGVFPRDVDFVDLFLPIFQGTTVSMVLVPVEGRSGSINPAFPVSMMRPFNSTLGRLEPRDVVRVRWSLRGESGPSRQQYYLVDTEVDAEADSLVLCVDGIAAWHAPHLTTRNVVSMPVEKVVSRRLAVELQKLLPSTAETSGAEEQEEPNRRRRRRYEPAQAQENALLRLAEWW